LPYVKKGFINYFGQQRFSSGGTAKIGKEIIKSDFESAVKIILSEHSNQDEFDKFVLDNWKNWAAILKECPRFFGIESKVLNYLVKNPTDYAGAIRKIAKPLRRLYVHAFQSLIWNRAVSKMMSGTEINLPGHEVMIPDKLPRKQSLPLPGLDTDYSTDFGKSLMNELKKEKIDVEEFNLKSMPELKSFGAEREVVVKPKNLKFSKDLLSFELDKGVYATVLISHLTYK
jgi:TruD family tRNA pseudouridine synthase